MAGNTIGQITLAYRGETQQFTTVSQAAHFLRQDRIKIGWFHKVRATIDLMENGNTTQTRDLKGDKFRRPLAVEAIHQTGWLPSECIWITTHTGARDPVKPVIIPDGLLA